MAGTARDLDVALGVAVRAARLATGLSQTQLASKSGVDLGTISRVESGSRRASWLVLARLSYALRTTPDAILEAVQLSSQTLLEGHTGD